MYRVNLINEQVDDNVGIVLISDKIENFYDEWILRIHVEKNTDDFEPIHLIIHVFLIKSGQMFQYFLLL
jgi:hypothetical protein